MSLEVYSRQSKAFQYDGYKINSEMREHINAEKSSSNVHKDRDTVNFSAEGRNMCYGFGVHDVKDRAKHQMLSHAAWGFTPCRRLVFSVQIPRIFFLQRQFIIWNRSCRQTVMSL